MVKDVVLTFAGKGEGLRRMTIIVAADDVRGRQGRRGIFEGAPGVS